MSREIERLENEIQHLKRVIEMENKTISFLIEQGHLDGEKLEGVRRIMDHPFTAGVATVLSKASTLEAKEGA